MWSSTSPVAPSAANVGRIVAAPIVARQISNSATSSRLWVASLRTLSQSPAPTRRAITDDVPIPMPSATLVSSIVIGNVNVTAAICAVPSWPMKPISITCTMIDDDTASIIGAVRRNRLEPTGPWVRSRPALAFHASTASLPSLRADSWLAGAAALPSRFTDWVARDSPSRRERLLAVQRLPNDRRIIPRAAAALVEHPLIR